MSTNLNDRELATMLFALRFLQFNYDDAKGTDEIDDLGGPFFAEHFENCEALTEEEIDGLCEKLNVQPANLPSTTTNFLLKDDTDLAAPGITGRVTCKPAGVDIFIDGYGTCGMETGHGSVIFLEQFDGRVQVMIWADINREDPTHTINLVHASERERKE